ncbi:hypothetical protein VTN31DRAFT_2942 [Thermomyces dupontii]|uniref:uncharacterized protein n=1 Tax=Talaromyces thermophilus TaxID=28565 RepID=UPI0037443FDE
MPESFLDSVERQRCELEESIRKLQQSLYEWRLWEAEYDALKQELANLPADSSADDLLKAGISHAGTNVNEKEVRDLIGERKQSRSRDQVVGRIDRRLDYVKQNVSVIEKRLDRAREELDVLLAVEQPPSADDIKEGEEFPVTEIIEELDEEGNVISGKKTTPGERAPELLEVLKQAGVEIPDGKKTHQKNKERESKKNTEADIGNEREQESQGKGEKRDLKEPAETEVDTEEKKQDEKEEEEEKADQKEEEEENQLGEDAIGIKQIEKETNEAKTTEQASAATEPETETRKPILTEQTTTAADSDDDEPPVTEIEESEEDAKLRREMLQYSFREVGAVVAELEMDEDASSFTISDEEDYADYGSDEDEEEDEYGRSTRPIVTEEIHRKMRELEEKLNAQGLINIGRNPRNLPADLQKDLEPDQQDEQKDKPTAEEPAASKPAADKPTEDEKKKKVSFAPELDIAPDPPKPKAEKLRRAPVQPEVSPVADAIVERTQPTQKGSEENLVSAPAPKKVSRFKSARSTGSPAPPRTTEPARPLKPVQQPPPPAQSLPLFPAKPKEPKPFSGPIRDDPPSSTTTPRPPSGKPLADTLVERPISDKPAQTPTPAEPDELDEEILRKEVATEFYRRRNQRIHEKGGFVGDDDDEDNLVYEDENGQTKRVSRFKAARMGLKV